MDSNNHSFSLFINNKTAHSFPLVTDSQEAQGTDNAADGEYTYSLPMSELEKQQIITTITIKRRASNYPHSHHTEETEQKTEILTLSSTPIAKLPDDLHLQERDDNNIVPISTPPHHLADHTPNDSLNQESQISHVSHNTIRSTSTVPVKTWDACGLQWVLSYLPLECNGKTGGALASSVIAPMVVVGADIGLGQVNAELAPPGRAFVLGAAAIVGGLITARILWSLLQDHSRCAVLTRAIGPAIMAFGIEIVLFAAGAPDDGKVPWEISVLAGGMLCITVLFTFLSFEIQKQKEQKWQIMIEDGQRQLVDRTDRHGSDIAELQDIVQSLQQQSSVSPNKRGSNANTPLSPRESKQGYSSFTYPKPQDDEKVNSLSDITSASTELDEMNDDYDKQLAIEKLRTKQVKEREKTKQLKEKEKTRQLELKLEILKENNKSKSCVIL